MYLFGSCIPRNNFMKILIVNNNTKHLAKIKESLVGHQLEIQKYKPGLSFNWEDKDLIILSGGGGEGQELCDEHKPGHLWYEDELSFVRSCTKPMIGICMGFEIIARAYGASVTEAPELIKGYRRVIATTEGAKIFGLKHLLQYQSHEWRVEKAPLDFEVLARSETGVEAFIKDDKEALRLGLQFHPEQPGSLRLAKLIQLTT